MLLLAAVLSLSGLFADGAHADTDITTANSSDDTETTSGDAAATNSGAAFAGHQSGGEGDVSAEDIDNDSATNVQEGDNEVEADQSANSESGAAVGGQVIGGVSSGDLTINATNSSEDVDVETGDADSSNDFAAFVGLTAGSDTAVGADIFNDDATNVQEGDNDAEVNQASTAVTGDGVAGQVLGAVSAGTTSVTLANTSEDTDATSGDSTQEDDAAIFTGLNATGIVDVT
jgi:hypothetical protein